MPNISMNHEYHSCRVSHYSNYEKCSSSTIACCRQCPSLEQPPMNDDVSTCASMVDCNAVLDSDHNSIDDDRVCRGGARIVENQSYTLVREMNYITLEGNSDSSTSDIIYAARESFPSDVVEFMLTSRDLLSFAKQIASGMVSSG